MGKLIGLFGRGWRFVRRYGVLRLYRKVKERRDRNRRKRDMRTGFWDSFLTGKRRKDSGAWNLRSLP